MDGNVLDANDETTESETPTEETPYREAKGDVSTERLCPACNSEMIPTRIEGVFFWSCTSEECEYTEQIV